MVPDNDTNDLKKLMGARPNILDENQFGKKWFLIWPHRESNQGPAHQSP